LSDNSQEVHGDEHDADHDEAHEAAGHAADDHDEAHGHPEDDDHDRNGDHEADGHHHHDMDLSTPAGRRRHIFEHLRNPHGGGGDMPMLNPQRGPGAPALPAYLYEVMRRW